MSTNPPTPQPKVIVLCFDGTANQFSIKNTNVVRLCALLDKRRPLEQIVYYQPGIGTFLKPGVVSPALRWLAKVSDTAVAWYINEHILGGYRYLMQNYREGDKICLFGFSRGAYTARALSGLLSKIGLLSRDNEEQIPFAYDLYKCVDVAAFDLARAFKQTFCCSVSRDTVASVGLIYNRAPPLSSSGSVRVLRHALSLDERRVRFQPEMIRRMPPDTAEHESPSFETSAETVSSQPIPTVLEVWFAGCHSDVGGSAAEDKDHSLADISLRWMIKQIVLSKCGIKFDGAALRRAGLNVLSTVPVVPTSPTEEGSQAETGLSTPRAGPSPPVEDGNKEYTAREGNDEDVEGHALPQEHDFQAKIHDEMKTNPGWWILEILPVKFRYQRSDGRWASKSGINLGRSRKIRDPGPAFHISVRQRMAGAELGYTPRAKWKPGTERYVDRKTCLMVIDDRLPPTDDEPMIPTNMTLLRVVFDDDDIISWTSDR